MTIFGKLSDIEQREQSYQTSLLDLSNQIVLSKSSFSDFRLRSSQKMALNEENIESQDQAIKDLLETISGFEWKLSESNEKLTLNANQIAEESEQTAENRQNIQGLLKEMVKIFKFYQVFFVSHISSHIKIDLFI